ncbi:MAG: TetR/AcrR family transcriptional regulator [Thermaurantiacus sp.]
MVSKPRSPYHHGGLRYALLATALDVLEQEGPAALSLRGLARAVGVSPMAPYHHFRDREALLAAIATTGFLRLQQRKVENEAEHPDVRDALAAGAANYVAFMLESPNLYRLMHAAELADRDRHPELRAAAAAPAQTLARLIARLRDGHRLHDVSVEDSARMLWGLAHGIGTLALDGQLPREAAPELARKAAATLVTGWLNPPDKPTRAH